MAGTSTLSPEQQAAVANVLPTFPLRTRAIVTVLGHTGYRITEALSLTVGDVWDGVRIRPRVRVTRAKMKGGKGCWKTSVSGRTVLLNAAVESILAEYLFERFGSTGPGDLSEPLFPSRQGHGTAVSRWQVNRMIHQVLAAAGIANNAVRGEFGSHTFRKIFSMRVYEASGHNIVLVRDALGHRSVETTERYLSASRDELERVVAGLAGPAVDQRTILERQPTLGTG